jgi:hypothetical protein
MSFSDLEVSLLTSAATILGTDQGNQVNNYISYTAALEGFLSRRVSLLTSAATI